MQYVSWIVLRPATSPTLTSCWWLSWKQAPPSWRGCHASSRATAYAWTCSEWPLVARSALDIQCIDMWYIHNASVGIHSSCDVCTCSCLKTCRSGRETWPASSPTPLSWHRGSCSMPRPCSPPWTHSIPVLTWNWTQPKTRH